MAPRMAKEKPGGLGHNEAVLARLRAMRGPGREPQRRHPAAGGLGGIQKSRYKKLTAARTRFGPLIRAGSFQYQPAPCGREGPPSLWKGELKKASTQQRRGLFLEAVRIPLPLPCFSLTLTKAEVCRADQFLRIPLDLKM
jgi:hypothetical protein